jgi:hypothetical protein
VRFLYVHPRDGYLSIDLEHCRDVIERSIEGVLDIDGWDLRKALQLMRKSNPPLFEWLHSPVVYWVEPGFREAMRALRPVYYSPTGCAWHYLPMARGNDRDSLHGDRVRLKKYRYVLRPLLAVRWLESGRGVVPMPFRERVETLIPPGELRDAIEHLPRLKQGGEERAWGPRIPALSDGIAAELARLVEGPALGPAFKPDPEPLDAAFRAWLRSPSTHSLGSTGSDSSANTPNTHSWTRRSGSRATKRSSASSPRANSRSASARLPPSARFRNRVKCRSASYSGP